jgi:putative transposase
MGNASQDWLDTVYVLSRLSARKKAARDTYHTFVAEGMAMGKSPELTGGGLIRSKGGWSQVLSARRSGQKEESDERILGCGDFVNAILQQAEEKTRCQLKLRRTGKTIGNIIEEECKKGRISRNELRGGSRRRKVSILRATIAKRGLDELGLSMAEIARHVGVTTSSIAKAVARVEKEG